jgi:hypothetical protein
MKELVKELSGKIAGTVDHGQSESLKNMAIQLILKDVCYEMCKHKVISAEQMIEMNLEINNLYN